MRKIVFSCIFHRKTDYSCPQTSSEVFANRRGAIPSLLALTRPRACLRGSRCHFRDLCKKPCRMVPTRPPESVREPFSEKVPRDSVCEPFCGPFRGLTWQFFGLLFWTLPPSQVIYSFTYFQISTKNERGRTSWLADRIHPNPAEIADAIKGCVETCMCYNHVSTLPEGRGCDKNSRCYAFTRMFRLYRPTVPVLMKTNPFLASALGRDQA